MSHYILAVVFGLLCGTLLGIVFFMVAPVVVAMLATLLTSVAGGTMGLVAVARS